MIIGVFIFVNFFVESVGMVADQPRQNSNISTQNGKSKSYK